ncbi:hypothetical protein GZ78_17185 [Endozoicomonas numazuensis]|uniref:Uncharacterized protein n=1 Tax=Endozoicomonas numazuensis TaxID=1137799 RepID=A0A081NGC2_9GAMM|nr:hypothetical protein GZ78_17185 [Endozoicomonas numazuensis]
MSVSAAEVISALEQQDPANHVIQIEEICTSQPTRRYSASVQQLIQSMQESTNIQVQSLSEGLDVSLWQPIIAFPAIEAILLSMEPELNGIELTEEKVLTALQLAAIHFQTLAAGSHFENSTPLDRAVKLWLLFKLWLINTLSLQVDEQVLLKLLKLIFEGMGNASFPVEGVVALQINPAPLVASSPGQLASTELLLQLESLTEGQQLSFNIPHNGVLIAQNLGSGQVLLILNNNLTVTAQNQDQLQKILNILFSFTLDNYQPPAEPEYSPPLPVNRPSAVNAQLTSWVSGQPPVISLAREAVVLGSRLLMGTVIGFVVGNAVNRVTFGSHIRNNIPLLMGMLFGQAALWSTPYEHSPRFTQETNMHREYARSFWEFFLWLTRPPADPD